MAQSSVKNHDFHILEPSSWPIIGSFSALLMAIGALALFGARKGMEMSESTGYLIITLGLIGVLYTMYAWWSDVVKEAEGGHHTEVVQIHHRYGMILFIASEVMFFVAWFWAYFDAAFFPDIAIQYARTEVLGSSWPPVGIETLDAFHIPLINTLILLLSGTTVTWAHHAIIEDNRKDFLTGLLLTVLLGALFTAFQIYEYAHATFAFSGNIYSSTFYMATGFHGFHVFVGTVFLLVCLLRANSGHFKPGQHIGFESAAWYWHFVDVVWIFLFIFVYVMPEVAPHLGAQ